MVDGVVCLSRTEEVGIVIDKECGKLENQRSREEQISHHFLSYTEKRKTKKKKQEFGKRAEPIV